MFRRHDRPTTMHTRRWIFGLMVFVLISPWARGEEPPPEESSPFSQAKYVPDISLILDCSYLMRSLPDECYEELTVPGTAIPHEHETSHRGFNLNYAEITFYSIVDPYFELFAVLHVSEHHLHLEEAYFLTKRLPAGLQLKGGKFRSGFGRLNEQHAHYWDFANPPLILEALFGPEGLNEVGARVSWVAPLETYLMLSGELLMGENAASFGRTGIRSATASFNEGSVNGPGLWVAYGKTSFDVGDVSVLLGASAGRGTTRLDEGFSASLSGGEALSGHTLICGGDLTIKYFVDAIRYVALQGEFLYRSTDATHYADNTAPEVRSSSFERRQSGFYFQAVAKLGLQWRAGMRFDLLGQNTIVEEGIRRDLPRDLPRISAMVEFNPTEFSRLRLQYNYDRSRYALEQLPLSPETVHELSLQINLAIGAHGAHAF